MFPFRWTAKAAAEAIDVHFVCAASRDAQQHLSRFCVGGGKKPKTCDKQTTEKRERNSFLYRQVSTHYLLPCLAVENVIKPCQKSRHAERERDVWFCMYLCGYDVVVVQPLKGVGGCHYLAPTNETMHASLSLTGVVTGNSCKKLFCICAIALTWLRHKIELRFWCGWCGCNFCSYTQLLYLLHVHCLVRAVYNDVVDSIIHDDASSMQSFSRKLRHTHSDCVHQQALMLRNSKDKISHFTPLTARELSKAQN